MKLPQRYRLGQFGAELAIVVTSISGTIVTGNTEQLSAVARNLDGTTTDVTATATWLSSSPAHVSVNATGLITGVAAGPANITATLGPTIGEATITDIAPAPVVTSITPNSGVSAGGTVITDLHGTNFSPGLLFEVTIGGVSVLDLVWVSSTKITCETPAHALGVVDVVVTNGDGQDSGASGNGLFTYSNFNPAALNATSWVQGSFTGLPWVGIASAGTSGLFEEVLLADDGGTTPTAAPLVNGLAPAHYLGSSNAPGGNRTAMVAIAGGAQQPLTTIINVGQYSVMGLIDVTAAFSPGGNPYNDPQIIQAYVSWGIAYVIDGGGVLARLVMWHHTVAGWVEIVSDAFTIGSPHFFCARYDGVNGQIDIDSVSGTPEPIDIVNIFAGSVVTTMYPSPANFGQSAGASAVNILERMTLKDLVSDATRDNFKNYLSARWNVPL